MATQAVLIADTVAGMKRAVARSRESALSSDSGDSINRCTNRGNKLKRKARYVHEGQLDRPNGPKVYKRKIEHAGYYKDVISNNPHRYDDNGDELDEDEEDEEADAAAAAANPYSGILLHELLGPLISAAELPVHPSLSVTYQSPILSNMLQDACEMIRRERNTIRGAKQFLTRFRGDETWIPCCSLDSNIDDVIFDTTKVYEEIVRSRPTPALARNKNGALTNGTPPEPAHINNVKTTLNDRAMSQEMQDTETVAALLSQENTTIGGLPKPTPLSDTIDGIEKYQEDVHGTNAETKGETTARHDFEVQRTTLSDANASLASTDNTAAAQNPSLSPNNEHLNNKAKELRKSVLYDGTNGILQTTAEQPDIDITLDKEYEEAQVSPIAPSVEGKEDISMLEGEPSAANDDVRPIAHRMRTRAQAQAVSDNATSTRTRSRSVASSFVPPLHPLFLIPDEACPDRDWGLPPEEAEATRRILMSYVQKQEEVCRGAEKLYNGLLKAERMKKDVFDSCKAEGHVGEMSDGEDWYDKEEWGLEEDLRKGHDEEEDDAGTQHKKTRGRRA